jgi:hypothetical protein
MQIGPVGFNIPYNTRGNGDKGKLYHGESVGGGVGGGGNVPGRNVRISENAKTCS